MKCLTVCNPWPVLIFWTAEELRCGDTPKRVENRNWPTDFRGQLLIHAGKSKNWLRPGDEARYPEMLYGYVIGTVDLIACVAKTWKTPEEGREMLPAKLAWVADHAHAHGDYCWVLDNPRRFSVPVKARGQQGLFDLPGDWLEKRHETPAERKERLFDLTESSGFPLHFA